MSCSALCRCHHYALPLPPPPLRLRVTGLWVPPFRSFDSSLLGALPSRSHIWPDLARNALSRFFLFYLTDWYSALVRLLPSNFSPFHFRFSWFLLSDDLPVYDFLWWSLSFRVGTVCSVVFIYLVVFLLLRGVWLTQIKFVHKFRIFLLFLASAYLSFTCSFDFFCFND